MIQHEAQNQINQTQQTDNDSFTDNETRLPDIPSTHFLFPSTTLHHQQSQLMNALLVQLCHKPETNCKVVKRKPVCQGMEFTIQTGLKVRRYVPVWYNDTSLVGMKSNQYRHFFLADYYRFTGMPQAAQ